MNFPRSILYPAPEVIISGENRYAAIGLIAFLQMHFPYLPVHYEPCARRSAIRIHATPGCLVIVLLCTRMMPLPPQLRVLTERVARTHQSWLLLYEGERDNLPDKLFGFRVGSMSISLSAIFKMICKARESTIFSPLARLTPRQCLVMKWLASGLKPRQVGEILNMTEKTVSSHRTNALSRLGLSSRNEYFLWCLLSIDDFIFSEG